MAHRLSAPHGHFDFTLLLDDKCDVATMADFEGDVEDEACYTAVAKTIPIRHHVGANSIAISRSSLHSSNRSIRSHSAGSAHSQTRSVSTIASTHSASSEVISPVHHTAITTTHTSDDDRFSDEDTEPRPHTRASLGLEPPVARSTLPVRLLPWESPQAEPSPYITLPVLTTDLDDGRPAPAPAPAVATSRPPQQPQYNTRLGRSLSRLIRPTTSLASRALDKAEKVSKYRMVRLTRDEYFAYWARDPVTGRYTGTEPEGEGLRRLREGLTNGRRHMSLMESRGMLAA